MNEHDTTIHGWDGPDRRHLAAAPPGGIPPELIAYIDMRIERELAAVRQMFERHIADETRQLDVIKALIERNAAASEARHEMLLQRLAATHARTEAIEQAFLDGPHGPDYRGHHADHSLRRTAGQRLEERQEIVLRKTLEWGSVAILSWIGYALWQAFLQGPHQ